MHDFVADSFHTEKLCSRFFEAKCDFRWKTAGRFAFLIPLWGGDLETTYDVHIGLIGKCVVDFLLVLIGIKLFSLGITTEALRANIA